MGDLSVFINYKINQIVGSNIFEPDYCVNTIKGHIYDYDDNDKEVTVGYLKLYYCDLERAFNNDISFYDVLDAHSSSTERYYSTLFDIETEEVNPIIFNLLGYETSEMNFLIIDRIEILPEFRGKGLSKYVLEEAVKMFSNKTFAVVLEPFPLQDEPEDAKSEETKEWDKMMDYKTFKDDKTEAKEALVNHYKNLGFIEIPESGFMLCTNEEWI